MGNQCQPVQNQCTTCKLQESYANFNEQTIDVEEETYKNEVELNSCDSIIIPIKVLQKGQQQFQIQKVKQRKAGKVVSVKQIGVLILKGKPNKIEQLLYQKVFKGSKAKIQFNLDEGFHFLLVKFCVEVNFIEERQSSFKYEQEQSNKSLKSINAFLIQPKQQSNEKDKNNTDKQDTTATHDSQKCVNKDDRNLKQENSQNTIQAKAETINQYKDNSLNQKASLGDLNKAYEEENQKNKKEEKKQAREEDEDDQENGNIYNFKLQICQFPKFAVETQQVIQENSQYYNVVLHNQKLFINNSSLIVKNYEFINMKNNSNVIIPFKINSESKNQLQLIYYPKVSNKAEIITYFLFEGIVDKQKDKTLGKLITKQKVEQNWFALETNLDKGQYTLLIKIQYPVMKNLIKTDYELFIFSNQTILSLEKNMLKPYHDFGGY